MKRFFALSLCLILFACAPAARREEAARPTATAPGGSAATAIPTESPAAIADVLAEPDRFPVTEASIPPPTTVEPVNLEDHLLIYESDGATYLYAYGESILLHQGGIYARAPYNYLTEGTALTFIEPGDGTLRIIDLDDSADLDNAPICTGPFKVKSFKTEGTVELDRNENYWNGSVKLDGVIFYFMNDDETKLMAMQSGEIDGYSSVTAAAKQIYAADPDHYVLTVIPATRLQFYVLNQNRLSPNIRKAINLTVDSAAIAEYLGGTVSPAVGPFSADAPYGKVTKPAVDLEAAKAAIEADGYTMNADGYYEKDGKVLTVNVSYYFARSLDTIALLLDGQFKQVGIKIDPVGVEDADATYRVSGDYDMALYCMVADSAGDPYYCINALFRQSSDWAKGGFKNDECEALINELQAESDTARRAELANRIVQMVIDDDAFGFIGLFNKTTVAAPGVVNIGEYSPLDCYAVSAETDMP